MACVDPSGQAVAGDKCAVAQPPAQQRCSLQPCDFCAGNGCFGYGVCSGGACACSPGLNVTGEYCQVGPHWVLRLQGWRCLAAPFSGPAQVHPCGFGGLCRAHYRCPLWWWPRRRLQVPADCDSGVVDVQLQCCGSGLVDASGACCPAGAVLDAAGACCDAGVLDACGVCGGAALFVDTSGACCATLLDANGVCCQVGASCAVRREVAGHCAGLQQQSIDTPGLQWAVALLATRAACPL